MVTPRRKWKSVAAAVAMAAGIAVATPAAPAHAVDVVPCDAPDYLWVRGVRSEVFMLKPFIYCFANAGRIPVGGYYIYYISTGNNDIVVQPQKGDAFRINRWTVREFDPPPLVSLITIL